ncbi:MAG: aspartate kinase [Oscillospiraceae bacterium]
MEIKVVKFGGSSLADATQFRKVAAIVAAQPTRRYVVASAPGKRGQDDEKVTDLLYRCADLTAAGQDAEPTFAKIRTRYDEILTDLGLSFSLTEDYDRIWAALHKQVGRDYLASRGEYLNAKLLAQYLQMPFVDTEDCVFFDDTGRYDPRRTYTVLGERLSQIPRAVLPGFYGALPDGRIKTFSRGGSDITGAIVARAVHADLYENWTDVSGMLMADPRCVKDPRVIQTITYRELRELAYMGATVLHDEAIFPVREGGIPIHIRNTNAPAETGTAIVARTDAVTDTVITGIAGRTGFTTITIEKDRMNGEIGFCRKILEAVESYGISVEHMPTGIDTMSVVVATSAVAPVKDALTGRIFREAAADSVTIEDGMAMIAVVGRGMVQSKGTAGRVFAAIAKNDINIRMIDQGSGEDNIIIGVEEADYLTVLNAIYAEFVKSEEISD